MNGRDLIAALEREGFAIVRRSTTYVWMKRGDDRLMLDEAADVSDEVANALLERARRALP